MKDEALRMALEALEYHTEQTRPIQRTEAAILALREALAAPVQEPVAVKHMMGWVESLKRQSDYGQHMRIPGLNAGACFELALELEQFINTTTPAAQRPWVGLTDEEVQTAWSSGMDGAVFTRRKVYEAIEAKVFEKNGAIAVPDAIHHTDLSEHPEYIQGWNDCRQAMLEMRRKT